MQTEWTGLVPASSAGGHEGMEQKETVFQGDESGSHTPKTPGWGQGTQRQEGEPGC